MVLKWAGLRFRRLFASQFRVAKGVSVSSVVNYPRVDLTVARRFWYNSRRSARDANIRKMVRPKFQCLETIAGVLDFPRGEGEAK